MVHRQKVIGPYIVDFYIAERQLVIELDGSQHYDAPGKQTDGIWDQYLQGLGLTVLRYPNSDIDKNFRAFARTFCPIWSNLRVSPFRRSFSRIIGCTAAAFGGSPHQSSIGSEEPMDDS